MGIETFRERLNRTERLVRRSLQTAGGEKLIKKLDDIERIQKMRKGIDNYVKPSKAGFGTTGEATKKAAHGGKFDFVK